MKRSSIPQCQKTERTLPIMQKGGTINNDSSRIKSSSISNSDASSEYSPDDEGDLLMRDNIFHTCCHVARQLCSIIIDGGSSVNISRSRLVEKLKLPTLAHPRPYKSQWLNSEGELAVSLVFTLGKYEDGVLYYVVSMEATHILLRRPWQYDRMVTHDRVTNGFSFVHRGQKVTLKPLSPKEVNEDQDIPHGLLPIRGIKSQIDFTMEASLPNKYRANPKKSKEIPQ
ncbi:hypothetical protein CR513_44574, partial [Mucuna pruriens]